ncbi:MAG: hypothetical protein JO323_09870 [Acidobacteriia bacterium]|nr:hypothetical protein [Terriglobia bacterium]
MPVTWNIDGSILLVTLLGTCGDEVTTALNAAMADSAFKRGMSLLLDVRRCTHDPTSDDFRQWAISLAARRAKGLSARCAVVIGPRAYDYGVARMGAAYLDNKGIHMGIFTSLDEAIRWLEPNATAGPVTE